MFELNRLYNADCMEAMKEIPDNFFELAITDPPYGIGADGQRLNINKNPKHSRKEHAKKEWDGAIPSAFPRIRARFRQSDYMGRQLFCGTFADRRKGLDRVGQRTARAFHERLRISIQHI